MQVKPLGSLGHPAAPFSCALSWARCPQHVADGCGEAPGVLPAAKPLPPGPGTDHLHLLPRISWVHGGGPGAPETPLLGPAAAGGAQRVKPVTAAATQLPGDPTGTGTPGCPVPPTHTPRRRFIGSGAVQRCCPPRDPAPPHPPTLPLRAAGPWNRGGRGDTHLVLATKGRRQPGSPTASLPWRSPAAPRLPQRPPRPGCALFACYFWQPPKSSSQAINNESAKFVWPLLYKER